MLKHSRKHNEMRKNIEECGGEFRNAASGETSVATKQGSVAEDSQKRKGTEKMTRDGSCGDFSAIHLKIMRNNYRMEYQG